MKAFQVFNHDVAYFLKKPMLIISFIAIAFIPILYSGFLIKGSWDPYNNLENLPVAVVNLDQGAIYQGKSMTIGKDFIKELKKTKNFDWRFVDQEEEKAGMEKNRYYASVTIPEDFSAAATSLSEQSSKQAEIIYESNSYYNFIGGQISESATKEIRTKLSQNLTEAYTRSIFTQFKALATGLDNASKGATEINTGSIQVSDGVAKVHTNLTTLSNGANKLNSSVVALHDGASRLQEGSTKVSSGAKELANGVEKLSTAGTELQQGSTKAIQGTDVLKSGLQSYFAGISQLTAGVQSSGDGINQLDSGLTRSVSASENLANGSSKVALGLQQFMNANPELAANPDLQKLLSASQAVSTGSKELLSGQKQLLTGSQSLKQGYQKLIVGSQKVNSGQQELLQGVDQLQVGLHQLNDGLVQYNSHFSQLVPSSSQLASGSDQVTIGIVQLQNGLGSFSDGMEKIANGTRQLEKGTESLYTGTVKLTDGSGELASKLKDAARKTDNFKADDQMIKLMAQPVKIKANDDRKIKLYAKGIAPYFISIALFAGSLVFTTVFSARNSTVEGATGFRLFVSKILTFGLMSVAQAILVCTILVFILGFKVQNLGLFYLFTLLVALTFMFVIQGIVTWLDLPGRFVALVVMILQLTSSAGTFPLELLPKWAQALNPWLPMTYSIRGFKDIISSGNFVDLRTEMLVLSIFMIVFVLVTLVYFLKKQIGDSEEQVMPVKI
ncbi:YhgE/Pip family protein [Bacillus sp. CGMCC 1.16607]|uniref:YhgE/Pip family protein n=1 Tax=Bacillus sp. CGMCC 1.16607 TaxID=3351842 RepID=UPI003633F22A